MNLNEFLVWLRQHGCELIPMPEWSNATTIQLVNTRNGKSHFLNTKFEELWPATIETACARLGVPLPPDYD